MVDSNNDILGQYGKYIEIEHLPDFVSKTNMYEAIGEDFANRIHTHTISQINNFPTTMPPSSHTHAISQITNFPTQLSYFTDDISTITSETVEVIGNYASSGSLTFYKIFNIVIVEYHISTNNISDTNDHTVANIPNGFVPSVTKLEDVVSYNQSTARTGLIRFADNGVVTIRMGTSNTSLNVYGHRVYVI